MPKARVLVEGNVQGVGYRALVKQVARRMKIKGKVKNLDDGSVEIYCEANRDAIEKFLSAIDKKSRDPTDVLSLNVEKISICYEDEEGYVPPDEELGLFEIDYGEEAASAFEKSNLEKLEIGTLILADVSGKQDLMLEKQDATTQELHDFRVETKGGFSELGERYHVISEELISINKNVARVHEDIAKSNENIAKLTEYIAMLVENYVKKRGKK